MKKHTDETPAATTEAPDCPLAALAAAEALSAETLSANANYGSIYVISRNLPDYMTWHGRDKLAVLRWIAQYLSAAQANVTRFPAVFNSAGIYSVFRTRALYDRILEAQAAADKLHWLQRALTRWENLLFFHRDHAVPVLPPVAEAGMLPTNDAALFTGIVGMIVAQVALLRSQVGFNESLAGQFGLLPPPPAPAPDPATFDPAATAHFNGGWVEIRLRSPRSRHLPGVEFAEIRVDRGDGKVHLIGTTAFSRFADHHEVPEIRTLWKYWVCYTTRDNAPLGRQSTCEVVVEGRVA